MVLLMMEVVNYDISRRSRVIVKGILPNNLKVFPIKPQVIQMKTPAGFLKYRFFQKV
jgi:hypothetical protein